MEPTETITTPAAPSETTEPVSTETQQPAQAAPESQSAAPGQVEASSNQPQVPAAPRPRPSDYYRERQSIRELKETVARLQQTLNEKASLKKEEPGLPEVPDFDPQHFSPEHKRILLAREQAREAALRNEIAALKQEVYGWKESKQAEEGERKNQEALEKLFPKTSPDSKESLQERIRKDPERAARIREFLVESGLNEFSKVNPDLAVEIALQKLGETRPSNPTVLKKALMGGNGSGNPGMGDKRTVTEQDLMAEKNKLSAQLEAEPSLRFDEKFMERRRQVLGELERLVTKK